MNGRDRSRPTADVIGTQPAGLLAPVLVFALAYFLSAMVRAIVATLAPSFSSEFALTPADLGLLAGAYFLGFAVPQLALGHWLDYRGPKRVLMAFLLVAAAGSMAFATSTGLAGLVVSRAAIGFGVSACLMAPLTAYRSWFSPQRQLRLNSWMLMTGSFGMLASTLPVQWLLPWLGWRGIFWCVAGLFVAIVVVMQWVVPAGAPGAARAGDAGAGGYVEVFREPAFRALAPLAFVLYGGMIAVQTLWAGPWLTQVAGRSGADAARALFGLNLAMLCAFATWGWLAPSLVRAGWTAPRLMAWGLPVPMVVLFINVARGEATGGVAWAAFCVSSTFVSLAQPYVGQRARPALAGRALSAFNLVIFAGVFALQWSIGALVGGLIGRGWDVVSAYRGTFGLFAICALLTYAWYLATMPRALLRRAAEARLGSDGATGPAGTG